MVATSTIAVIGLSLASCVAPVSAPGNGASSSSIPPPLEEGIHVMPTGKSAQYRNGDLHLTSDDMIEVVLLSSFWNYDQSVVVVGLEAEGTKRRLFYIEPGPGSDASVGDLIFEGTSTGTKYVGHLVEAGRRSAAQGPILNGGNRIELSSNENPSNEKSVFEHRSKTY